MHIPEPDHGGKAYIFIVIIIVIVMTIIIVIIGLQGLYQVKFVVDGQWQTAPDWPTVETPQGTNNLLEV